MDLKCFSIRKIQEDLDLKRRINVKNHKFLLIILLKKYIIVYMGVHETLKCFTAAGFIEDSFADSTSEIRKTIVRQRTGWQ